MTGVQTCALPIFLVLVGIAATALWLRRRSSRRPGPDLAIRVLCSRGLSGKHRVSVLEVGDDRFLVALDTAGTHLISRLGSPPDPPAVTAPAVAEAVASALSADAQSTAATAAVPMQNGAHRLRLVTPAPIESLRIAEDRVRRASAMGAVAAGRQDTARAIPAALARIATAAVSPVPARLATMTAAMRPGTATVRTRMVSEPPRATSSAATDPTLHAPPRQSTEETDVAGLLRAKSPWRQAV